MFSVVVSGGDCITLVSEILHINNYESAKIINDVFNLGVDFNKKSTSYEIKKYSCKLKLVEQFKEWENESFQILCDYLHLLWKWGKKYEPKNIEDEFHDLYVKALQEKNKVQYYIDIFIYGTDEDKVWFWKYNRAIIEKFKLELERRKNEP